MFSSTSSPQTAPTTPDSSSNNSDEVPSGLDSWGYPSSSTGYAGVSTDRENEGCPMPLTDLINESHLTNSPVALLNTHNILPSAWLSRTSSTSITDAQGPIDAFAPTNPYSSNGSGDMNAVSQLASMSINAVQETNSFPPEAFGLSATPHTAQVQMFANNPNVGPTLVTTGLQGANHGGVFNGNGMNRYSYQLHIHDAPKKSRVETQVKLRLELLEEGPAGAGRPATKWGYIRVPRTASVKQKTRNACDPDPSTVLSLTATVFCASNTSWTNTRVPCCENCQTRERKRNSKKVTANHSTPLSAGGLASNAGSQNQTPATSDAEAYASWRAPGPSGVNATGESMDTDDYVSPVDFTCYQHVDFSSGIAQVSFRVVCYCRHYREKVGFSIVLTLRDNFGRVVGETSTTPIMITDDHKSVQKFTPAHTADEEEADSHASAAKRRTKRIIKQEEGEEEDTPLGGGLSRDSGTIREGGVGAIRNRHRSNRMSGLAKSSPGTAGNGRVSSTSASGNASGSGTSGVRSIVTTTNVYASRHRSGPSQHYTQSESATTAPSSPSAGFSPPPSAIIADGNRSELEYTGFSSLQPPNTFNAGDMGVASLPILPISGLNIAPQSTMTPVTISPVPVQAAPPNPFPHITRVIPAAGSKLGGIEVTLFGANFTQEALINAGIAFGPNVVLFGTNDGAHVWDTTVLICTLPASAITGPVEVKLLGVGGQAAEEGRAPLFTYTDEGDKDLMMQALQMLGWQNSGQLMDPRSVAMDILGTAPPQGMMLDNTANADFSSLLNDFSTMSSSRAEAMQRQPPKQVEVLVMNVLRSAQHPVTKVIGHISTPHPVTGQTLLHIASALGYYRLVHALIGYGAKVDVQDRNGFSPVHFACFYGRLECLEMLVRVGRAHLEGKDIQGRSPLDVCGTPEATELILELEEEVETRRRRSRAPSEIESGGEGDDEGVSWSEADEDEDDRISSSKLSGADVPQSVSRRISRVGSIASIASNRRTSRPVTPFTPEGMMTPIVPVHPPSTNGTPIPLASTWGLPRNIAMPWPVQLPAGWQLPNVPVPSMPQFTRRWTGMPDSPDGQKDDEKMFRWMMWMDAMRNQLGMLQAQQQQRPAIPPVDTENDPPPKYSPTSAMPPQEKQLPPSLGTPAVPTMLEEPPSPLSLDSPYTASLPLLPLSKVHLLAGSTVRHRPQQTSRRRAEPIEPIAEPAQPTPKVVGKRRERKQQDKMLYYFWIPVLLLVFAWASYKSLATMYRLLQPSQTAEPAIYAPQAVVVEA